MLETIVAEAGGRSLETVEDPEIEGIMLAQCTRISASVRETFRPGGYFKSIPIMGQRDLTMRWATGAGQAKLPLIEKGLITDDGGGFFGWGVEQGHLGKTEIFCKYSPLDAEAREAVGIWAKEQAARAIDEKYFALTIAALEDIDEQDRARPLELPPLVGQGARRVRSQRRDPAQGDKQAQFVDAEPPSGNEPGELYLHLRRSMDHGVAEHHDPLADELRVEKTHGDHVFRPERWSTKNVFWLLAPTQRRAQGH